MCEQDAATMANSITAEMISMRFFIIVGFIVFVLHNAKKLVSVCDSEKKCSLQNLASNGRLYAKMCIYMVGEEISD